MQRKLSVICFIDSLGSGGAQRQMVGLANQLSEAGFNVQMLVYHDLNFFQSSLNSNIELNILPESSNIKRIFNAYWYIKREKPDWVISFLESPSIISCIVKVLYPHFKLIVSERNTTQHIGRKERLRFNLFRMADYVVPNAYSQEKFIKDNFHFLQQKTTTIANFVDLEYFAFKERTIHPIPQIMVAASIWQSKNTLNFIRAVKTAVDKGANFFIKWFGFVKGTTGANLEYYDACNKLIEDLGVGDYIQLLEKTANIKEEYYNADFFCLPSYYEGTPNVICEAIATGLPVICSDVSDNARYVKSGINGYLFSPNNINDISDSLLKICSLPSDEWKKFSKNSRNIAEDNLCMGSFLNQYINLIKKRYNDWNNLHTKSL